MGKQIKPRTKKLENLADWHGLVFGDVVKILGTVMVYKENTERGKEFVEPPNKDNPNRIPAKIISSDGDNLRFRDGEAHPIEYWPTDYIKGRDDFDKAYEALRMGGLVT